jgi:UDP-glucuronate 4-epimerase
MQPGDVYQTYADNQDLFNAIKYTPKISVKEGVAELVVWFKNFYKI